MSHMPLKHRIIVRNASDLSGTLDSTVIYFIDGEVDMGSTSIEVPQTGLQLQGSGFGVSKLTTSEDTHTLFVDDGVYSGDLFIDRVEIEVTGAGSQVFDLDNDGNFGAVELTTVNFNDCTSLGTLDSYRQGLETNTGRFGGSPSLTLSGTWVGGYRITTSIVRSLAGTMTQPLFKEGTSFTMASRFLTDINCDLPTLAAFCDFDTDNFTSPSLFQIIGAIFTRDGASDASDTNILPNIDRGDLSASWKENQGIQNTFEGGNNTLSSESATTISSSSTFYSIAGTWTASELQHFDSPSSGQLRHLGNNPREYRFTADLTIESTQNKELEVRLRKYDSSATTTSTVVSQVRPVNNLAGGRDVAFFTILANLQLDQNDYVFLEVANNSGTDNVTLELDSFYILDSR